MVSAMASSKQALAVCALSLSLLTVEGLDNGLARTPPMGWLSWVRFRCNIDCLSYPKDCISERLYMDMADRLVADGYRDAGYVYVNIDDCWSALERDSEGRLQADPLRFPSGIKFLADYMHKRGLKLGIYGDMGYKTCGGYPGNKFYMEGDAMTFAEWGIDSFKMDGCFSDVNEFPISYPIMGQWLNRTGRPILYSCSWPTYLFGHHPGANYTRIAEVCNIWRNYRDVEDSWAIVQEIMTYFGNQSVKFSSVAHPGAFNDPDQLIIGNFGLSHDQERVQMAVWAILAGPLLMSNDLRSIRKESRDLLLNRNLIAINQDPLGIPGVQVTTGDLQIWRRPISPTGSFAVAFLNFYINQGGAKKMQTTLQKIGLVNPGGYNVTEGFTGVFMGLYKPMSYLSVMVNPSGVFLIVARPVPF
ncbi:alpha-N-acetylgalactosaminidase-like isoform X2 [Babylonia areolata]|uniref:alpha-N-acetylgalactosaminidase-like isoform X2 n=1 Tax=Babylonia areolata TaxID=304850 RepID=UPI003FD1B3BE